jgi:hypothetical protein
MANHPVLTKVLCVALVASIMLPLGRMVFPFVDTVVSGLEFDTIQAVLSVDRFRVARHVFRIDSCSCAVRVPTSS